MAISGDPHEVYFRFAGKQRGYIGNNGTADTNYAASIQDRTASPGTGAFRNGGGASLYADFDQSLQPITSYYQGSQAGFYTVRSGETLASIAATLWGDASLWYQLAEVNGLSAGSALNEGQILSIPASVVKNTHNANTFTPYDPSESIGATSPTAPQPGRKGKKCGGLGQIIMVIIAVVVTVYTAGAASAGFASVFSGGTFGAGVAAGSVAATGITGAAAVAGSIVGGAAAGAAGSIVSQAVGVATGIQDKFSWNAVALAAIGGGVGGGLSGSATINGALKSVSGGNAAVQAGLRGAIGNAITQGVSVATGLQDKFSWAGIAAAGVGAGVFNFAARNLPGATHVIDSAAGKSVVGASFGNQIGASGAQLIADAASRTLIEGTDFGDNVMAALPNVAGSVVGERIAAGIAGGSRSRAAKPGKIGGTVVASPTPLKGGKGDAALGQVVVRGASGEPSSLSDDFVDFILDPGDGALSGNLLSLGDSPLDAWMTGLSNRERSILLAMGDEPGVVSVEWELYEPPPEWSELHWWDRVRIGAEAHAIFEGIILDQRNEGRWVYNRQNVERGGALYAYDGRPDATFIDGGVTFELGPDTVGSIARKYDQVSRAVSGQRRLEVDGMTLQWRPVTDGTGFRLGQHSPQTYGLQGYEEGMTREGFWGSYTFRYVGAAEGGEGVVAYRWQAPTQSWLERQLEITRVPWWMPVLPGAGRGDDPSHGY